MGVDSAHVARSNLKLMLLSPPTLRMSVHPPPSCAGSSSQYTSNATAPPSPSGSIENTPLAGRGARAKISLQDFGTTHLLSAHDPPLEQRVVQVPQCSASVVRSTS